ncbi:hypothetical protein F4680DRAFT_448288 [Xylaria scruposa]|nr:hypothetical protein F4680DRAFT_448288 [Xylaria scruposa]
MTCMVFNTFTARLHRLVGSRSKRNSHTLEISAPFGFKRETINLPGLSEDEIASLKEKVAASHLGVHDDSNDNSSAFGSPRKAPRAPPSPAQPADPAVLVSLGSNVSNSPSVTTRVLRMSSIHRFQSLINFRLRRLTHQIAQTTPETPLSPASVF